MSEERRLENLLGRAEVWADPPADLEARIVDEITTSDREGAHVVTGRRRWVWASAVAAAAAVVLFVLFSTGAAEPDAAPAYALEATDLAPSVQGSVAIGPTDAGWWLRLDLTGLPPAAAGTFYEGWVAGPQGWVSVGTFHMREGHNVTLWSGVDLREYTSFAVTLQEEAGSHDPSGELMLTCDWSDEDTSS